MLRRRCGALLPHRLRGGRGGAGPARAHPEVSLHSHSLTDYVRCLERGDVQGVAAVILGCTELSLIMNDTNSPLPTLDSTRLLARAALLRAVGRGPLRAQREKNGNRVGMNRPGYENRQLALNIMHWLSRAL